MENPFLKLFLRQITLKSHFYMMEGPFNVEKSQFLQFFQYFHLFFIGKELWYEVMTSINIPFFSASIILNPLQIQAKVLIL